jgi:HEPN domain-containing protein
MEKRTEEWLRQSDYDMETAEYLFRGGRYMYCVFMCHLAIEKALKGLYFERLRQVPPKSHSLVFLLGEIGVRPPEDEGRFIVKLSEASIPTRYPEDLAKIQGEYTASVVGEILSKGKEVVAWIRRQL